MRRSEIGNTRAEAWRIAAQLAQGRGEIGRDQNIARLVAFADDGKLRFARLARDDLRPGETCKLGDAQRAEVGDLQHEPIAPRSGGAEQEMQLDLREQPLRRFARSLPELDQRRGVEAREADLVREAEQRLHGGDVGVDGRRAARSSRPSFVRIASSAFCTSSTVARLRFVPAAARASTKRRPMRS